MPVAESSRNMPLALRWSADGHRSGGRLMGAYDTAEPLEKGVPEHRDRSDADRMLCSTEVDGGDSERVEDSPKVSAPPVGYPLCNQHRTTIENSNNDVIGKPHQTRSPFSDRGKDTLRTSACMS